MPQGLLEMAREKARKKNRPEEFRETQAPMTRPEFVHQRIAEAAAAAGRARDARRAAELRTGASPAPASVRNALEDAREKAAQKARERDAVPGAVVHNAPITTHKPLFGYFHQDGTFATGVRKGITGHRHGHIGNHLRTTRKNWFGFGGRRRRSRRRKQRGGCGAGLCMSGGRRRRRKTRRRIRKKRKTRRRRKKRKTRRRKRNGGFLEKCTHSFLFKNPFSCTACKMYNKVKCTCGVDGYCKTPTQAVAQKKAIKKLTGVSIW